ncbi:DNA mismatch repair protein MutS [[Mycoplasma] phocae]|uniref:DNA mismatch repair protein MutS n=1 Tax=[Mycoplasma] phocae TaxID=142651 RepID=A0A2Z5IQK2_9BACT|nr:DNA mismatch repair protein MutS [[Mycoplasma] phocae]AXE60842.1 DNA mismatch repair protein MutS [[Mycoplasma] phocae]
MNFNFDELEVDLHGCDSIEATAIVLNALKELEEDEYHNTYTFIAGNGSGAIKFIVEDILEKEGYRYIYLNKNKSIIKAFKK